MSLNKILPDEMQLLQQGLTDLGLLLDVDPICQYLLLLQKWNKAYNLTAIRDMGTMITRHILDSLAILPWLKGKRIIDVGTGAGFPGIPIALANPDLEVVLLDSNGKKIRFLQAIKRHLQLDNIEIVQSRVEAYHPPILFDTVTSRAFSDVNQMLKWTSHLLTQEGIWLAMKGRTPVTELLNIQKSYLIKQYQVPGLEGERCCVIIENKTKD